jgi:hypothetical protein
MKHRAIERQLLLNKKLLFTRCQQQPDVGPFCEPGNIYYMLFKASAAMLKLSALFWDIAQLKVICAILGHCAA